MQEEVENRTVNLAISTTKLTGRTIIAGTTPVSRHLNRWVSYHPPKIKKDAQTFYKSVRPSQYAAMRQRFFFYGSGDPNV